MKHIKKIQKIWQRFDIIQNSFGTTIGAENLGDVYRRFIRFMDWLSKQNYENVWLSATVLFVKHDKNADRYAHWRIKTWWRWFE
jgi:hypothetical protein